MPRLYILTVKNRKTNKTESKNANFSGEVTPEQGQALLERTLCGPNTDYEFVKLVEAKNNPRVLANPRTAAVVGEQLEEGSSEEEQEDVDASEYVPSTGQNQEMEEPVEESDSTEEVEEEPAPVPVKPVARKVVKPKK